VFGRPRLTGVLRPDGGVFSFCEPFFGRWVEPLLAAPIVGMQSTPDRHGYWLVASDGGVFSFGTPASSGRPAPFTSTRRSWGWRPRPTAGVLAGRLRTVVSLRSGTPASSVDRCHTPQRPDGGDGRRHPVAGTGWWPPTAASFSFGGAPYFGSNGRTASQRPHRGHGRRTRRRVLAGGLRRRHLLLRRSSYFGSMEDKPLNRPIVGMAAASGGGYWLVASDGGIFTFGGAPFQGSTGALDLAAPVVAMTG